MHPCTGTEALYRPYGPYRSRGIALPFHDHGNRRGWGFNVTPRSLFTHGKDAVPFVQEAGWAPGRVWTVAENLAPTGIRSMERPARSQSLYRLRYPAHCFLTAHCKLRLNTLYYITVNLWGHRPEDDTVVSKPLAWLLFTHTHTHTLSNVAFWTEMSATNITSTDKKWGEKQYFFLKNCLKPKKPSL